MKTHKQPKITLGVIIGISFAFTLIALFAVGSKVIFGSPDTPRLLNYQGKLTDSDGPVTGTVSIIFTIYDAGGTPIWTETHGNITVKNGLFNAILGGTTPIPDSVFSSGERYLGLTVNGEEITQKQQIVSVIFALKAQDADTIDGKSASEFAPATHPHDASDITSGALSEARLPQNAIDSSEIEDSSIQNVDISNTANISPSKISGTAWTSDNDGSGSGLDADKLDGLDSSAFLSTSSDYGRSGVASNLYEGTTKLSDKYLKSPVGTADIANNAITSAKIQDGQVTSADIANNTITETDIADNFKARDADKLDGKDSTDFLSTSTDYGRSGVASNLYEGTTKLSDKYFSKSGGTINGNVNINGSLVSNRHDISVGDTNAINAKANTQYASIYGENNGSGSGVWGESNNDGAGTYGLASGWYGTGGQTTTSDHYGMAAFGVNDNSPGLFARGYIYATGGVRTSVQTRTGNVLASAVTSPSALFLTSGSRELNNGMASIAFNQAFVDAVPPGAELRILLTPTANCNGLYVASKSQNGFVVRELQGGKSNASFDWIAIVTLPIHKEIPPRAIPMSQREESLEGNP